MNFSDILKPRTSEQIKAEMFAAFDTGLATPITATWSPGNILAQTFEALAVVLIYADNLAARLASAASLQGGSGSLLEIRCAAFEGVTRIQAQAAKGEVTVVNVSGVPVDIVASVTAFRNPSTQSVYYATESKTVLSGTFEIVTVSSDVVGAQYSSAANQVSELVQVRDGVSCTNGLPIVGLDAERDDALILRARAAPIHRQPAATRAKVENEARAVNVHGVPVRHVDVRRTYYGGGAALVQVTLAKSAAALSVSELSAVREHLIEYALGDSGDLLVVSAVAVPLPASSVVCWVASSDGRSDAAILAKVSAAVFDEVGSVPIGGHVIGADRVVLSSRLVDASIGCGLVAVRGLPADFTLAQNEIATTAAFTYSVRRQ
jgi:Baseplate J-like protein